MDDVDDKAIDDRFVAVFVSDPRAVAAAPWLAADDFGWVLLDTSADPPAYVADDVDVPPEDATMGREWDWVPFHLNLVDKERLAIQAQLDDALRPNAELQAEVKRLRRALANAEDALCEATIAERDNV